MGVFIASGGPIRKGVEVRATILDVTPTVLAILGLPVADDMPGRVLEEILEPAHLERFPVRRIDSYETLFERRRVDVDGTLGEGRMRDMLESLGYIGEDD